MTSCALKGLPMQPSRHMQWRPEHTRHGVCIYIYRYLDTSVHIFYIYIYMYMYTHRCRNMHVYVPVHCVHVFALGMARLCFV